MSRPKSVPNDKPFREALRRRIAAAGDDIQKLERVADALVKEAEGGNVNAIKELPIASDGRVPQRVAGSDEDPPIQVAAATIDLSRFTEVELRTIEEAMTLLEGASNED